jgi:hypothetical protein
LLPSRACFLSSHLSANNAELLVNLTKSDLHERGDRISLPRGSVQIQSRCTLLDGMLFERIRFHNFTQLHVGIEGQTRYRTKYFTSCGERE